MALVAPRGSHRVDVVGDKYVVRDLELFCGYDPEIDGGDASLKRFDSSKVAEIFEKTRKHMERGSNPQMVLRHEVDGEPTKQETIAPVVALRMEERRGVPYILGDVEFSAFAFERYIASNEYPRRSAEIWKNGHMSEIALLGRETPRRPLPDTRFMANGDKDVFAVPGRTEFGHSATSILPAGKTNMDEAEINAMKAECARLTKERDEMSARLKALEKDVHAKNESEKDLMARTKQAESERDQFAREREEFAKRLEAIEDRAATAECEQIVDRMERDGFAIPKDHRSTVLAEIKGAADRSAKEKFFRAVLPRVPVGPSGRLTDGVRAGVQGKPDAATVERFQREANGDIKKFRELMAAHGG